MDRAGRRAARASDRTARPSSTASPMPERPNTIASASSSRASVGEIDLDRAVAAAPGRTGSFPAAARRARRRRRPLSLTSTRGIGSERAIDLLGRRRGDHQPRAAPDRDIEREAVAARHAARGVDDHGLELAAPARRDSARAASRPRARARAASCRRGRLDRQRDAGRPRDWPRKISLSAVAACSRVTRTASARPRHRQCCQIASARLSAASSMVVAACRNRRSRRGP